MAYNTKYILSFCNKDGIPLRIELQLRDYIGQVFLLVNENDYLQNPDGKYFTLNIDGQYNPERDQNPIEGGTLPFELTYRNDIGTKGGTIRATEANMQFYEDRIFNIDDLATSDETQLRVAFYYNNELEWIGFATPDFFNTEITENPLINITASDRLGILKDVDYVIEDVYTEERVKYLDIITKCLKNTGLELNVNIVCDFLCEEFFDPNSSPFFSSYVSELRFLKSEETGETMDCYSVIKSICNVFNCFVTQYKGEWWIVNKYQQETGSGKVMTFDFNGEYIKSEWYKNSMIHFNLVDTGGMRTVMPAHAKNTILLDHGDDINYPRNRTFRIADGVRPGWINEGSFPVVNTDEIPYQYDPTTAAVVDFYKDTQEWLKLTQSRRIITYWNGETNVDGINFQWPHLVSEPFKMPNTGSKLLSFDLNIKAIGRPFTHLSIMVSMQFTDVPNSFFSLYTDGKFYRQDYLVTPGMPNYNTVRYLRLEFENKYQNDDIASAMDYKLSVSASAGDHQGNLNLDKAIFKVWVFPTTHWSDDPAFNPQTIVKEIKIDFKSDNQVPKGTIFQNKISGDFTKTPETITVPFGDYQENGQNGFFYRYRADSLSIQYNQFGAQLKRWFTADEQEEYNPLLVLVNRQISRSFGTAHDELRLGFDANRIDPFAHYAVRCVDEKRIQANPDDDYLQNKSGKFITADIGKYLNSKRFVFVEGKIDYLRSHFEGVLAQIRTNEVQRQEYIYSYFEQGDIS